MNIKGKKILVTGATGFVGANLVRHFLKKGANISILKRQQSNLWRIKDIINQISVCNADLLDYARVNKAVKRIRPEVIFHAAAYGGHVTQDNPTRILKTNFDGTVNLLDACLKRGFGLFVNTGSSSEYGIKDSPMKESDLLNPVTLYGISKAAASIYCQYAAKKHSLPIVTLRLFSPYGYFDDGSRAISYIILSCLKTKTVNISSPDSVRDFIFIDDVVDAYEKALERSSKMSEGIFNIGSGKQRSIEKLAGKITRAVDNNIVVKYPKKSSARIEPKSWVADISKSHAGLKWKPRFNIDEGLSKTIDWFRENKGLYS
ncbi:MAG: SDR family NAD(P)-dependent oxidoreductase [Candidatus Omnitrophica bacterium]|nr:SDR family NAD(P)-dependent oxidoreductase [Candidatus Omnitrophota bacterium]